MKITKADIYILNGRLPSWRPVVCRLETDEGICGYGEATVAFDLGAGAAFEMIAETVPAAIGMDPMENEVIWETLYTGSFWLQSSGTILMSALSAIDTAVWDIKAKAMGVPLYKALGGKFRDSLRCYASQTQFGWGTEGMDSKGWRPEDIEETTLRVLEEGYDALKVNPIHFNAVGGKLGMVRGPMSGEVRSMVEQRIALIRRTAGDRLDLMLEHHGRTDGTSAVELAQLAKPYRIHFLEEPCAPTDLKTMEQIRRLGGIPLAAGERLHGRNPYLRLLESGAIDVLQPDVGTCGGITEAKKICDLAYGYGRSVQLHVCGSPIAMAASMHLEAAIPNFVIHEHMVVGKDRQNAALGLYDYQPVGGKLTIPDLAGIGQELSDYAVKTALAHKQIC